MKVELNGNKMTIEVDLDKQGRPSSTGKMIIHYSSGGFMIGPEGYRINLTVGKKS